MAGANNVDRDDEDENLMRNVPDEALEAAAIRRAFAPKAANLRV